MKIEKNAVTTGVITTLTGTTLIAVSAALWNFITPKEIIQITTRFDSSPLIWRSVDNISGNTTVLKNNGDNLFGEKKEDSNIDIETARRLSQTYKSAQERANSDDYENITYTFEAIAEDLISIGKLPSSCVIVDKKEFSRPKIGASIYGTYNVNITNNGSEIVYIDKILLSPTLQEKTKIPHVKITHAADFHRRETESFIIHSGPNISLINPTHKPLSYSGNFDYSLSICTPIIAFPGTGSLLDSDLNKQLCCQVNHSGIPSGAIYSKHIDPRFMPSNSQNNVHISTFLPEISDDRSDFRHALEYGEVTSCGSSFFVHGKIQIDFSQNNSLTSDNSSILVEVPATGCGSGDSQNLVLFIDPSNGSEQIIGSDILIKPSETRYLSWPVISTEKLAYKYNIDIVYNGKKMGVPENITVTQDNTWRKAVYD